MSDLVKKFGRFNVRIVRKGEGYGLNRCLVNGEDHNLVEFYDARQDPERFGELGQFVSRYYLETLLWRKDNQGLCLDGAIPSWSLGKEVYAEIHEWLRASRYEMFLEAMEASVGGHHA